MTVTLQYLNIAAVFVGLAAYAWWAGRREHRQKLDRIRRQYREHREQKQPYGGHVANQEHEHLAPANMI